MPWPLSLKGTYGIMVTYKVIYYSRLTGEPLSDQQIPKIREDIEGNENETNPAAYPEGVYVKITNTETGEETVTLVDEQFYPTSSSQEEFDDECERKVAASGTEVTHFFSYYDLVPTEGVKPRTSSVYERPEWTFPTLEEYPIKEGITEENYEQYLPELYGPEYIHNQPDARINRRYERLFPETNLRRVSTSPYKGGWTKSDLRCYLQKVFRARDLTPNHLPKGFSWSDLGIRLVHQINQGTFTFTERHLIRFQHYEGYVESITFLKQYLFSLVKYEAKLRVEQERPPFPDRVLNFLEKTKVLDQVLELYPSVKQAWERNLNGCRETHGTFHSYRYSRESGQVFAKYMISCLGLSQLIRNNLDRHREVHIWTQPGKLLAQIEQHPQFYTEYLEYLNFFNDNPRYPNLEVLKTELAEHQGTMASRRENRMRQWREYLRRRRDGESDSDSDSDSDVHSSGYRHRSYSSSSSADWKHSNPQQRQEDRDLVTVQIASRELAQISQLEEPLHGVRTKYGVETFELLALLVGEDCTPTRIETCLKTIIAQLGTTENLLEITLIEKFQHKVVSPKGPVRVRNLQSMIDLETIYYLVDDDDLVVDSSGLAYSIEELRELYRSCQNESRPFRNPENLYFSDLDPLYLGRNFYKNLKLNKLVEVSL